MQREYLIKVGEIALKGGNRALFERRLEQNIKQKLSGYAPKFRGEHGRFFLTVYDCDKSVVENALGSTFGIVGFAPMWLTDKDMQKIKSKAREIASHLLEERKGPTFKIEARRSDKSFSLNSYQIASELGQHLRDSFPELRVDVRNPDWILSVEIRRRAILYGPTLQGPGGLPVGCAGKAVLLLSGGIDSPVAGYLMAKRGLRLQAIYFHTYPFTSDDARKKVESLAETLAPYLCGIELLTVPFTDVQVHIKENALEEEVTLLMRACMMRIASIIAERSQSVCLVTGEALSQVASQTPESLRFTQSTSHLPVFRPLIGLDKEEIIRLARSIGTYDISILPYLDCCALFSPQHPLIRPDFERIRSAYDTLDIGPLLQQAVENTESTWFGGES
jgi:thiamine biosynthesis protein ThiI